MIKDYFKITFGNLIKHKTYSLINIPGLATGIASSLIISRANIGLILIILTFLPKFVFTQWKPNLSTSQQVLYGPDDLLVNGSLYVPDHPKAEGNPYFQEEKWTHGKIVIIGKSFENIEFVYNVETDKVIIQSKDIMQNKMAVLLNRDFVDAFYIDEHYFINLDQLNLTNGEKGFAELIYRSGLTFIIKHKKDFLKQYSQSNQFGSYSKLKSEKYIQSNDQLKKLPTRKSFLDYFKSNRSQIKKYLRTNNIRYKTASKNELSGLLKFCDELPED
jgi:hypothetical protein